MLDILFPVSVSNIGDVIVTVFLISVPLANHVCTDAVNVIEPVWPDHNVNPVRIYSSQLNVSVGELEIRFCHDSVSFMVTHVTVFGQRFW